MPILSAELLTELYYADLNEEIAFKFFCGLEELAYLVQQDNLVDSAILALLSFIRLFTEKWFMYSQTFGVDSFYCLIDSFYGLISPPLKLVLLKFLMPWRIGESLKNKIFVNLTSAMVLSSVPNSWIFWFS